MWAEFGRRTPFGSGVSSKHSVEASAVGSTSSFDRRTVPHMKAEAFGSAWWRGLDAWKEASWWWIGDGHDAMVLFLGNKCCNRGRLGVMLEPGYKYKPLVFVIGIEQFHNKPAPCQLSSPSSRVVEFLGRRHRSVDLRKCRNLVSCLVSCICDPRVARSSFWLDMASESRVIYSRIQNQSRLSCVASSSLLAMFVPSPWNLIRLYSRIR
jgi:hypothetical protein